MRYFQTYLRVSLGKSVEVPKQLITMTRLEPTKVIP